MFTQVSYRLDATGAGAANPLVSPRPILLKTAAAPIAYNWTGLYGGVEGGGVFSQSKQIGQTAPARHTADSTPWFDADGGLAGGTVGYNAQFHQNFVFGMEADISWVDAEGSAHQIPPFDTSQTASTREDWLATARVSLDFTPADRWLVYATGGPAVAEVGASMRTPTAPSHFSKNPTSRPGWTGRAGNIPILNIHSSI